MQIGMVLSTDFPPQEGIGHYVNNLSKKLISMGHEVTIIKRGDLDKRSFIFEGIKVIELPYIPMYPLHVEFHNLALSKFLNENKSHFDILHLHQPLVPVPDGDLPIVTTIHSSMNGNAKNIGDRKDLYSAAYKIMAQTITSYTIRRSYNKSMDTTTVSPSVAEELRSWLDLQNIRVIENGVDTSRFYPGSRSGKYLLYVGRLGHGKGLPDLLEGTAQILRERNIDLVLCGRGELELSLRRMTRRLNISDRVQFKGNLDHGMLSEIYRDAQVFIFPSRYEGMPTVVLEAMASGLPILASDIIANRQIIEEDRNGLLFESGSPEHLREKLQYLLDNPALQCQLAKAARNSVLKQYDWSMIADKFIQSYQQALGR